MKYALALTLAACVGCSGKSTDAPEPAPKDDAAEATSKKAAEGPPGEAPPAEKAPETKQPPPKLTVPVIDGARFGGVTAETKLELAAIEKALPGFTIEKFETEAEGDTYVNFGVEHEGKQLAVIGRGAFGLAVNAVEPAIKDGKGIGLGSTFGAFRAAWPEAKCELFELKEPVDGNDPFSTIDCKRPESPAVWYRFDITDVKHGGEMPADEALADRPLTTFTADYGKTR